MADPSSRYRDVPEITAPDRTGRPVLALDIRPLPAVAATFQHVVSTGDRLDGLAARYYGRPTQWWQICDANPDVLSPLDLLADPPLRMTQIPLTLAPAGPAIPPWSQLIAALLAVDGVDGVTVIDDAALTPLVPQNGPGNQGAVVQAAVAVGAVLVRHGPLTRPEDLVAAVRATPLRPGPAAAVERIGQEILIPPLAAG
jgi:hypothetical protein